MGTKLSSRRRPWLCTWGFKSIYTLFKENYLGKLSSLLKENFLPLSRKVIYPVQKNIIYPVQGKLATYVEKPFSKSGSLFWGSFLEVPIPVAPKKAHPLEMSYVKKP